MCMYMYLDIYVCTYVYINENVIKIIHDGVSDILFILPLSCLRSILSRQIRITCLDYGKYPTHHVFVNSTPPKFKFCGSNNEFVYYTNSTRPMLENQTPSIDIFHIIKNPIVFLYIYVSVRATLHD